ncbi:hypothetical protein HK096_007740, partial [Nowakowskiella sp. JEL0078]
MSRFAQQPTLYQYKAQTYKDFMTRQPPPGYIAGYGRGATGFTTRSDIGPAREQVDVAASMVPGPADPNLLPMDLANQQQQQRNVDGNDDEDNEQTNQDPDNEIGLFASLPYEADDEEADRKYEEVDKKMDERRRARRE